MGIIGKLFSDSVADGIGGAIIDGIRSLCYAIDEFIYRAIIYLYDLFLTLCNGEILDLTLVQEISKRIGFILGTIMLFMVLISFLQMILNPEKANDKEQGVGNIVKKIIIVVVMLGLAPRIFSLTYDVQKILLGQNKNNTNVIQNVILPYKISNPEKFGANLSLNLFNSLYYIDENSIAYSGNGGEICQAYMELLRKNVISDSDYSAGSYCVNVKAEKNLSGSSETEKVYLMHFDYLISVLAGGFIVYILMIYCIKVGIRMIQLAFLQIISPMAFVSYLAPKKDTMFTRWKNMYISTYLDVFIRVAIISLVVLMISLLFQKTYTLDGVEQSSTFWQSIESSSVGTVDMNNSWVSNLTNIIMIIALLQFGKRAPELLKEILPKGGPGSIGFGLSKKENEGFFKALGIGKKGVKYGSVLGTGAAVGLIGGGINNALGSYRRNGKLKDSILHGIGGALGGTISGAVHGIDNAAKAKTIPGGISSAFREQRMRNWRAREAIEDGSTVGGRMVSTFQHGLGLETAAQKQDAAIKLFESYSKGISSLEEYADTGIGSVRNAKRYYEHLQASGASPKDLSDARTAWKNAQHKAILDILNGEMSSAKNAHVNTITDATGIARIQAQLGHLNRQYNDNQKLFDSFGVDEIQAGITDYDNTIDLYGRNAGTAAIKIQNSDSYEINKANDQYAYWESHERGGRIAPGTGKPKK